jgi:IclR family transcriptional regulator, acetate operon repressor
MFSVYWIRLEPGGGLGQPVGEAARAADTSDRFCDADSGFCIMEDVNDSTTELQLAATGDGSVRVSGGVQSIERAFDLLEMLADAGGAMGLSELASNSGLPLPTVHRLMRTLVNRGYVRQEASRRYTLGSRLIRLGETSSRMLGTSLRPFLAQLVRVTGETANLAMLDGDEVVYIAQVPSPHQMRMFTEPGRRVRVHCTAVGKALLAQLPSGEARAMLDREGMPAFTPTTITDPGLLLAHLEVIRKQGYAVDEGEQEVGVRCFAVAVPDRRRRGPHRARAHARGRRDVRDHRRGGRGLSPAATSLLLGQLAPRYRPASRKPLPPVRSDA